MRWLPGKRVESKIILLVVVMVLLPVILIALMAVREIEQRTLVLAQDQLRETAKTYGLSLFDHLEHAGWEMRMLQLGDVAPEESSLIGFFTAAPRDPARRRPELNGNAVDGLRLTVLRDGALLSGNLNLDSMFASLGHIPAGVQRCVLISQAAWRCEGSLEQEGASDGRLLVAQWNLPLSSVYETDVDLTVVMRQSTTSALRHVAFISRIMPLIMLLIVLLSAWMLIHLIRRRMAPLSELESATRAIREGHYDSTVEIHTDDEFQRLGDAFNVMTRRLDRSFSKMSGLADMDRLVLDGADLDSVIHLALSISSRYYGRESFAYLWREHRKQGRLYRQADGDLEKTDLCLLSGRGLARDELDHRDALEAVLGVRFGRGAAVRVDGGVSGELLLLRDGSENEGGFSTLDELADRISVAVTNMVRARSLYRQANYDSLTGLVNRQAFSDRVSEAVRRAGRDGHRGAVLFLDLDRFKQINDTEGHAVGDEVLRQIAMRLERHVRSTDTVCRLGGDEFAIIAAEYDSDAVITGLCRRLIDTINEPVEVEGHRHEIDVSIGVSLFPDDGTDVGTLLMKADVAMYEAKSQSGSAFSFYDSSLNVQNEHRVRIESGLRSALTDGSLRLHYQPKLELASRRIRGVEGLLRWQKDGRTVFAPDEFIPVAEDTGLIHRFTELLVSEVAVCLEQCDAEGLDPGRVAVNISTRQFVRQGFARRFLALLESVQLPAERLEIEITESLFIQEPGRMDAELAVLRDAGMHIALDDFGTGYSSLNMLRTLPLNTVKIDRSFVQPLMDSPEARKVAEKIIEMVSALGLTVVAEGVEHWQEVGLLERLGCDFVQGYVLEKPMPVASLVEFLRQAQSEGVRGYQVVSNR